MIPCVTSQDLCLLKTLSAASENSSFQNADCDKRHVVDSDGRLRSRRTAYTPRSLPEGLRQRFNANGIRGLLGRPYDGSSLKQTYEHLNALVQEHLKSKARR